MSEFIRRTKKKTIISINAESALDEIQHPFMTKTISKWK